MKNIELRKEKSLKYAVRCKLKNLEKKKLKKKIKIEKKIELKTKPSGKTCPSKEDKSSSRKA